MRCTSNTLWSLPSAKQILILRDSGKPCGSPKEALGIGVYGSLKHKKRHVIPTTLRTEWLKQFYLHVVSSCKASTYSGRQITRSPLLVPYANPRPGSGSQRAEFMLTCLLWSAGIGYRTLKTLWNNNRRLLDTTIQGRRAKEAQTNFPAAAQMAIEMSLYKMLQETTKISSENKKLLEMHIHVPLNL